MDAVVVSDAPLLARAQKVPEQAAGGASELGRSEEEAVPLHVVKSISSIGSGLLRLSFSIGLATMSQMITTASSVVVVGHYSGTDDLASLSLGTTFCNVTGVWIVYGFAEAIDTLCGQAWGTRQRLILGDVLQRSILILCCVSTVSAAIWCCTEQFLHNVFGQKAHLAHVAGQYAFTAIPGLYAFAVGVALLRYLAAQGVSWPVLMVAVGQVAVHVPLLLLLVAHFDMGPVGAAVAWTISTSIKMVALLIVAVRQHFKLKASPEGSTWRGFSLAACVKGWRRFFKLAAPACLMLGFEFWSFECVTLLAGVLPDSEVSIAAQTGAQMVLGFMFQLHLGIGCGTSCKIGNCLGDGRTQDAKRTALVAMGIDMCGWSILAAVILSPPVRHLVADRVFVHSSDSNSDTATQIAHLVYRLLPIVVVQQFGDGVKEILNGVMRGTGRPGAGMLISAIAYAGIALPLGAALAFGWFQSLCTGVEGLFVGLAAGTMAHGTMNAVYVLSAIDWDEESQRAINRVRKLEYIKRSQNASPRSLLAGEDDPEREP